MPDEEKELDAFIAGMHMTSESDTLVLDEHELDKALANRVVVPKPVPPPPMFELTEAEKLSIIARSTKSDDNKYYWDQIYKGGNEAIDAARRLLAKTMDKRVKYVVRSHDSVWWLTKGGLQEYAPPPRGMVFDTQLQAEQAKADYIRDAPGLEQQLRVEPMEVGE